jgi:hypothetical protein
MLKGENGFNFAAGGGRLTKVNQPGHTSTLNSPSINISSGVLQLLNDGLAAPDNGAASPFPAATDTVLNDRLRVLY